MIKNLVISDDAGLLKTKKQFILIIHDEIHGPFKNEDWKKIAKVIKEANQ